MGSESHGHIVEIDDRGTVFEDLIMKCLRQ